MREEVQRISKLVADGKLSPEDAAALIDAFYESDRYDENEAKSAEPPPPPPPPSEPEGKKPNSKDPFRTIIESIEKMTKEGIESVDWGEVSKQAKQSAKKGFEQLKTGLEEISKGKVNIGWLLTHEERDITLPLTVPVGKTLKIDNAVGDIKVVGGFEVGSVTAHVTFRGATIEEARAKADTFTLVIEESDHIVEIRQPDVNGISVDLEIQLPGHANVDIKADSGDIQVVDTKGGCRLDGRSGNITLRGLDGIVEVSTSSGNISIEDSAGASVTMENKSGNIRAVRTKGNLKARTASGDITVTSSSGKVVSIETVSGNVTVDLEEAISGTLNVRTVNGNAMIGVPDGNDCRVSLSTLRGNVHSSIALEDEARAESRVTGKLGAGAGTLDVSAVTGNITLELRDSIGA
ncbi:MAG: DUF4097 family beta strand repeat-containing protein [Fimbriimonas sp.]|nr:DUF4097 family beta strand repeat-containing protein [Fimbriimonas sp.]